MRKKNKSHSANTTNIRKRETAVRWEQRSSRRMDRETWEKGKRGKSGESWKKRRRKEKGKRATKGESGNKGNGRGK